MESNESVSTTMLQEREETPRRSPIRDLILVFVLLALIILARGIMTAVRTLPYGGALQILLFLLVILLVYGVYKKFILDYRYTLTFAEPDPADVDAFGDVRKNPYPLGSLIVERMVGDKAKLFEAVMPEEYVCLLPPAADGPVGAGEKYKTLHLTVRSKKQAYSLYFRRSGTLYRLFFAPSAAFAAKLDGMIAELQEK